MNSLLASRLRVEAPAWLRSTSVAWFGALLVAVVAILTAGFLFHEERNLETNEIASAELYARVLQDHAERTFNTVDIAMAALVENVNAASRINDAGHFSQDLSQAQAGLPFLRSLSLMTAEGRVIASSSPGNIEALIDLKVVRLPPEGAADSLGTSLNGRDLVDAEAGAKPASASRTFVPLVRALRNTTGAPLFLVAVLNPDFFANEYELNLADATRRAAIVSIDGVIFSGTGNIRKGPGENIKNHRFLSDYLPARESGSFVGPGIDQNQVVTAFRTLRKRPLVVVVERSYADILASFRRTVIWTFGIGAFSLVVIAGTMVLAWRSLRSHESVRSRLEATQLEVATSERDLRILVESVHELIFRADATGLIAFVNGRWSVLTGRPGKDILGRRLSELCREEEGEACDSLFVAFSGRAETIVVHIASAFGRQLTMELSVSPVLDAQGQTIGFAGFAVDVSEREAAQQALKSQLTFTAQLLEVSPTPIFVKDERGRFVSVNRAWLELMNFKLPDVLGRNSEDLYGFDSPKHNDQDARLMLTEERVSYENRLSISGRPSRDTVVTKVRFTRGDGTPAGIVGSIIDVTEFREAERRIREARDAAQLANSAKSEFIANISHELRTPLQGIIGFSEIGRDMAGEQPDFLDMFTDIFASGQRMLTLVNGLLDVAQMDSAVGSLPLQRIDVAQLIREAASQQQPKAVVRDVQITLNGLEQVVEADVDRIRFQQAVRNVLANAVRYSPIGDVVDVSLVDKGRSGIELTVRDHGPGVPDAELELIFEAFVQSSRTRDGSGGTGLGLTITRKIMSAHGGSVVAANADGGGALFSLSLPAAGVLLDAQSDLSWQDSDGLLFASEVN